LPLAPNAKEKTFLRIFEFLASAPFTEGDNVQLDRAGRGCQVKRFGEWLIVYWPEHLVSEIHILDVERLTQKGN